MDIYIELLVPLVIFFIFISWKIWFKWSKRRLIKKYKPENDRGRKGTERESTNKEELRTGKSVVPTIEHEQHEGRELLSDTSSNDVGKDLNSNRKIGFFRRRKS